MNVAIYVRVSTIEQNLENQKIPLVEYCKRMGWTYEIFEEKESTRKTRPVQWDLFNRLLRKEFDGLVIYSFSRWARSSKELIDHMERLIEKKVLIYSYTENLDLSSSMGRAMFTIISAFAQLERDIISERTKAGLARARAQGKKLGRPSKGGSRRKPSRAEISNLMGKGLSIREMAKELNTSKYWVEVVVKEIKIIGVSERGGVLPNET